MTRHQNHPHRTLLRTGLPAFFLIFLVCFLPGPVWAVCDFSPLRSVMDKTISGEIVIVLAKAGPVIDKQLTFAIADGFGAGSDNYLGEAVTYNFSVERSFKGEVPEKIEVGEIYWKTINGKAITLNVKGTVVFAEGEVYFLFLRPGVLNTYTNNVCSPNKKIEEAVLEILFFEALFDKINIDEVIQALWKELSRFSPDFENKNGKTDSGAEARPVFFKRILKKVAGDQGHIPDRELRNTAEICGLLAEKDEALEKILFAFFKEEKEKLSTDTSPEMKRRHYWVFLLASILTQIHKPPIEKAVFPVLEEGLQYPDYSRRHWAKRALKILGTPEAYKALHIKLPKKE